MSDDAIWIIYSMTPYESFPYTATPTVPITNRGPALLQKASSRSASVFETLPLLYSCEAVTAPIGNPLIIPIIKAHAPAGGTLNKGRITGSARRAIREAKPEYIISPDTTKNGKIDGIIVSQHRSIASLE